MESRLHALKTGLHALGHVAIILTGCALFVAGLGMTFTIVFVIPGIVMMAIGGLMIVGGAFAHAMAGP